jgi:hypothetical protein
MQPPQRKSLKSLLDCGLDGTLIMRQLLCGPLQVFA